MFVRKHSYIVKFSNDACTFGGNQFLIIGEKLTIKSVHVVTSRKSYYKSLFYFILLLILCYYNRGF